MKFSVCIVDTKNHDLEKVIESLEANSEYIDEIIYSGLEGIENAICLNIDSNNEAAHNNACAQKAKSDYILLLTPNIELEEETLEEFAEVVKEHPDADIIYPNEVFIIDEEEQIKNYDDWYQKEQLLLPSLAIEDYLPQWAVLVKKETIQKLGGFDPKYGEHAWYAFIYKNLDKLRLKLSDLSFVNHYLTQTFVDTSYRSLLVRDIVAMHPPQEIFTSLDWSNEPVALATAYTMIGNRLAKYIDYFNASDFYRKALMSFHNQETLRRLVDAYYQMGLFDEAMQTLRTQEATSELAQEYEEKIEKTKKLISEIEQLVQNGKAGEVLAAANDISQFYQGAPIYNILGVIMALKGDKENAYKFLYKAATMNPLERDILENIAHIAKELGKEEEVAALYTRMTQQG